MMNLPKVGNHDIQIMQNKTKLGCHKPRHYASSTKLLKEVNTKAARMIDLLKVIKCDTKMIQWRATLATYFHSKQVFPATKQTKRVNIEDAQSAINYFTKIMGINTILVWYFTTLSKSTQLLNHRHKVFVVTKNIGNAT